MLFTSQVLRLPWWNEYVTRRLGQVEVVINQKSLFTLCFPRLPYCQQHYHLGATPEAFVSTVNRESQESKHLGLLLAYPDVEVRVFSRRVMDELHPG